MRDTIGELRETGGFAFTHVGNLSKQSDDEFDWKDAEFLIDGLWLFLSFSRGALVAPSLPIGFGADEQVQLIDWRTYLVSPWRGAITWLDPTDGKNLEGAFTGFMDRWGDDFWRDVLRRSIRIYVQANHPDPLETAIIMAQTALELLAWAVLVEQEQWVKEGEGKLPAAARLRLLLKWSSIPTAIPEKLEALTRLARARTPNWDGPTAVAEVRNALVHPKKADELREAQVMADVWMLALWYLELTILRVIGYENVYSNRLRDRWAGDVDPVPWAPTPASEP